jgi:hypothetical protein
LSLLLNEGRQVFLGVHPWPQPYDLKDALLENHTKKNLKLFTGVGRFFQFLKNRQFQFFQYSKIIEWVTPVLWKEIKIKESLDLDTSKNLFKKPIDFHERTGGSLPDSLTFSCF